ncbi:MAG: Plasmid stabilization system protein [Candidatus Scalindua rubra]|uniref:Plasmid stabilization system protein n=1 Tax=Candidatus Scalindua rubra TaxID=1872076 RepID=A0A1E3X942_9BACT|nr:MAG: Plasmid stabilization system protein [Candidatus Scalindua rubra]
MMSYHLFYHPDIQKEDLPNIPKNVKERIRRAIEQRLLIEPEKYGEPLKRGLKGYRKLRVGDYRVIYKVEKENIIILKIGHRKEVYSKIHLRVKRYS